MKLHLYFCMLFCLIYSSWNWAVELSSEQLKAAYVLNFAKFTEWPVDTHWGTHNKVTLCVLGNNVLNGALNVLEGRKVGAREMQVISLPNADENVAHCHLVFVGSSEQRRAGYLLDTINSPTLIISDIPNFAGNGGHIGLLYRNNRVVFEVNWGALQRAQLHVPSQLLNLAASVFRR